jgi:hypothetical protein
MVSLKRTVRAMTSQVADEDQLLVGVKTVSFFIIRINAWTWTGFIAVHSEI